MLCLDRFDAKREARETVVGIVREQTIGEAKGILHIAVGNRRDKGSLDQIWIARIKPQAPRGRTLPRPPCRARCQRQAPRDNCRSGLSPTSKGVAIAKLSRVGLARSRARRGKPGQRGRRPRLCETRRAERQSLSFRVNFNSIGMRNVFPCKRQFSAAGVRFRRFLATNMAVLRFSGGFRARRFQTDAGAILVPIQNIGFPA